MAEEALIIYCETEKQAPLGKALSEKTGAPLQIGGAFPATDITVVCFEESGVFLAHGEQKMQGDFSKLTKRLTHANLSHELLVKAAKGKKGSDTAEGQAPLLVDATAGMGEDSLLLAAAGFRVLLFERDPVIAALLKDAVERARSVPELRDAASRMTVTEGNSIEVLPDLKEKIDVVLLDPMFPEREKSALVKKKFQLIHHLEKPCDEEEELLMAALSANPRKILVKRPLKGPYLANKKPSYSLPGKSVRVDVIIP